MNPSATEIITWIACLGLVVAFIVKIKGLEQAMAKSIITEIKAEQADSEKKGTPQPLIITEAPIWVDMETYRLNRDSDNHRVAALDAEVKLLITQSATQAATSIINGSRLQNIEKMVGELPNQIISTISNAEHLALARLNQSKH